MPFALNQLQHEKKESENILRKDLFKVFYSLTAVKSEILFMPWILFIAYVS